MKKKYRIVFLEPNYEQKEKPGFDEFMEPLGLGYVARAAFEDGHHVKIMQQFDKTTDEIIRKIMEFSPDILAMSFVTKYFNNAVKINNLIKKQIKNLITVVGGAHPTGYPEITARHFDFVVLGEGEHTFLKLLKSLEEKEEIDFRGIAYYNSNGEFISTGKPLRLNFIYKFPYRDGLDFSKYTGLGNGPPPVPFTGFASLLFTKGCRYNCFFCQNANMWLEPGGRKVKVVYRGVSDVIEEMKMLHEKKVSYVWFQDPDFPLYNKELMEEFIGLKKKYIPELKFSFMTRIDNIYNGGNIKNTLELLKALKTAGCHMIGMGIESSNSDIMKSEKKYFKESIIKDGVNAVFNTGIIPVGFFMLGFPTETEESVINTYEFAKKLNFIRYRFGIFYPYRGTHDNTINLEWLEPEEKTFDKSNHEHQVVKCNMEDYKVENYFRNFNELIYREPQYRKRIDYFISNHPDMKLTIEKWREYLKV